MPLNATLLSDLEAAWRRLHPPLLNSLQDGLSHEEMEERMRPTGLVLPPELRAWWSWHNGPSAVGMYITPACELLSLDLAIEIADAHHENAVAVAANGGSGNPDDLWPPTYLPVFKWADWTIAADCTIQRPSSPLFCIDAMHSFGNRALVAPSVGDAVGRWVEMYEAGYYVRDESNDDWVETGLAQDIATLNLI
jgi:cell wall assembly regulator SMI1